VSTGPKFWGPSPQNFSSQKHPKFGAILDENDQVLLVHSLPGMRVPLTIFFKAGSKIGLNFSKCMTIT